MIFQYNNKNCVSRNGTFLVRIWADLNGEGIENAATRIVDRLNR